MNLILHAVTRRDTLIYLASASHNDATAPPAPNCDDVPRATSKVKSLSVLSYQDALCPDCPECGSASSVLTPLEVTHQSLNVLLSLAALFVFNSTIGLIL